MSLSKRLISTGAGDSPNWMGIAEYTGNTGTRTFSGLSNPPDLLLFSGQDTGLYGALVSRTFNQVIYYSTENTSVGYNGGTNVVTFTDDGFTIPTNTYTSNSQVGINSNGSNWIVNSFSAGDGFVSNTDGSVTTQVNANPDMGFSIVKWTGVGSSSTFGHGLNSEPRLIIVQDTDSTTPGWRSSFRDNTNTWKVSAFTSTGILSGDNYFTVGGAYGNSANSSTFSVTSDPQAGYKSGRAYIAYLFTDIAEAGTKFFQYAGNSSTTQRNFTCGFDPKLHMTWTNDVGKGAMMNYKMASSGSSSQWTMTTFSKMYGAQVATLVGSGINYDNTNNRIELLTSTAAYNKTGHNYLNLAFGGELMEEMTVS